MNRNECALLFFCRGILQNDRFSGWAIRREHFSQQSGDGLRKLVLIYLTRFFYLTSCFHAGPHKRHPYFARSFYKEMMCGPGIRFTSTPMIGGNNKYGIVFIKWV